MNHSMARTSLAPNSFWENTLLQVWSSFLSLLGSTALLILQGCASNELVHQDKRHYIERAHWYNSDDFDIEVAALSSDDSEKVFGTKLDLVGMQPVWIRINNKTDHPYWLFPLSVDNDYFPPYEVARRASATSELNIDELYQRLVDNSLNTFIEPASVTSGFIYTHSDEGMKAINIELQSSNDNRQFSFVTPVPGLPADFFDLDPHNLYQDNDYTNLDETAFWFWLEEFQCCTVNDEDVMGDPLNIVFVGSLNQVRTALISRHWDVTAPVTQASLIHMFSAFMFGSRYRYAPMSPLYVFNRDQDLSFQKARAVIDERNHMRLWLAPVRVNGSHVWIGQISRDVGIKWSHRFWPPTTHVIDPDMDDARFYLVQEMLHAKLIKKIGFVRGHIKVSPTQPHYNAENDPYFTDGLRAVFFLADEQASPVHIQFLDWRFPAYMETYSDLFTTWE